MVQKDFTTFYALPKTHKSLNNPIGRPIVSGVESLTKRASRVLDANRTLRPRCYMRLAFIEIVFIRSIPYSQYLRLRHNCSKERDYKIEADKLKQCPMERGYSHATIRKAFNGSPQKTRQDLLFLTQF